VLAPLYPDYPDFEPATRRLSLFLQQYWGGPTTYSEERGHPKLRMRHMPFHLGPAERDHWLAHMASAVEEVCSEVDDGASIAAELMNYFVPTAEHLRNDTGLPITPASFRTGGT
jgi:hemoglobin